MKRRNTAIAVILVVVVAILGAYFGGLLSIASTECPHGDFNLPTNTTGFKADFFCSSPSNGADPLTWRVDLIFGGNTGPISAMSWDFGDGTPALMCQYTGPRGTSCNGLLYATHTYESKGTYTISLSVSDGGGHNVAVRHWLIVGAMPPPTYSMHDADFTYSVNNLTYRVQFHGTVQNGSPPFNYYWNFGDNSSSMGVNVTHVYEHAGNYSVTVTVSDATGAQLTFAKTISVGVGPSGPAAENVLVMGLGIALAALGVVAFVFYVIKRKTWLLFAGGGLVAVGLLMVLLF